MTGGLDHLPNEADLGHAYEALLSGKSEGLALYSQWVRLDPRLAQIWVEHVCNHWQTIAPIFLRDSLLRQPWPNAAGVLLEFAKKKRRGRIFSRWADLVVTEFPIASGEQFFIGLRALGGEAMAEEAAFSAEEYARWGYLSRENILGKSSSPTYSPETRRRILENLLLVQPRVRLRDYWQAVDRSISRRQAERDLAHCLTSHGQTKARYYRKGGRKNRSRK